MDVNNLENNRVISPEESDVFCFETDHVALRGNADYQELLKTFALLEAQRSQAIKDLDELIRCREEALADPIDFVHKLQNNVDLGLPKPQTLAELPEIDWHKYSTRLETGSATTHKHKTRYTTKRQKGDIGVVTGSRPSTPSLEEMSGAGEDMKPQLVRGKLRDQSKPDTFNKPWSAEEQKKLEELLIKYPPEAIEARRWEKIANELGDRTKHQVQSRIQKYFIRLAKDGLPVPGRVPNMRSISAQRRHAHQRYNRFLYPESTMYASYRPPVYMSDEEESSGYFGVYMGQKPINRLSTQSPLTVSDEEDIPSELRDSEEYREILRLKQQRKAMLTGADPTARHMGYKCDRCGCDPIVGTRWHCTDCPQTVSTDFCDQCYDLVWESGCHKSCHQLEAVYSADTEQTQGDSDYLHGQLMPGDYNYLDPNYMPAS